jgi:hypothetical protein
MLIRTLLDIKKWFIATWLVDEPNEILCQGTISNQNSDS